MTKRLGAGRWCPHGRYVPAQVCEACDAAARAEDRRLREVRRRARAKLLALDLGEVAELLGLEEEEER